jgi:hypothetical protein
MKFWKCLNNRSDGSQQPDLHLDHCCQVGSCNLKFPISALSRCQTHTLPSLADNFLSQILNRTLIIPHLIWPRASEIQDQSFEDLMEYGKRGSASWHFPCFCEHVFAVQIFDLKGIYHMFRDLKVWLGTFSARSSKTNFLYCKFYCKNNGWNTRLPTSCFQIRHGTKNSFRGFKPRRIIVFPRKPSQDTLQVFNFRYKITHNQLWCWKCFQKGVQSNCYVRKPEVLLFFKSYNRFAFSLLNVPFFFWSLAGKIHSDGWFQLEFKHNCYA